MCRNVEKQFSALFLLIADMTFSEYIRKRRIDGAVCDLCNTDEKIIDIAMKYVLLHTQLRFLIPVNSSYSSPVIDYPIPVYLFLCNKKQILHILIQRNNGSLTNSNSSLS